MCCKASCSRLPWLRINITTLHNNTNSIPDTHNNNNYNDSQPYSIQPKPILDHLQVNIHPDSSRPSRMSTSNPMLAHNHGLRIRSSCRHRHLCSPDNHIHNLNSRPNNILPSSSDLRLRLSQGSHNHIHNSPLFNSHHHHSSSSRSTTSSNHSHNLSRSRLP